MRAAVREFLDVERESPLAVKLAQCISSGERMDITLQKQAAAEALLQREELAHLSRVAALSTLSGSLAHELNQPLTSILSNAQAAQRFMAIEPIDLAPDCACKQKRIT